MPFPSRLSDSHKGENGKVLVVGGSKNIHGAPILCALGVLASGVDLVRLALPKRHEEVAKNKSLSLIIHPFERDIFSPKDSIALLDSSHEWADVAVLGCGFFREELSAVLHFIQHFQKPIVLDAGALQPEILPFLTKNSTLLTPHAGEFSRLFSLSGGEEQGKEMAKKWKTTILQKGKIDFIASSKEKDKNTTGCSEMTVGGTGDVLAGICAGLMARGFSSFGAASLAAKKWGKAGEDLKKKKNIFSAEEMIPYLSF